MATKADRKGPPPEPVAGRVAVVGVCAAGKSVLVTRLRALGYDARSTAQEHSFVPDMWQRLSRPQVLVYLDVSLPMVRQRRAIDYDQRYLDLQRQRLAHARHHAHINVHTDPLTEEEVCLRVVQALRVHGIEPTMRGEPDSAPSQA